MSTTKISIISTKNPILTFNLKFFGDDMLSITLNDNDNNNNNNHNNKYGELLMKKVSETNVYMSEFIIHSYKFNTLINERSHLKGRQQLPNYYTTLHKLKIH